MPIGKCPLCLQEKQIIVSHLIPAAIYTYCRGPDGHHVTMTNDLIIETDRELQDYLLCSNCDNDLNSGGETWLMPLLASIDGNFPFHDMLTKAPPDVIGGGISGYAAARNPDIDNDKIIHFAMGVFWKAAIHSWSGYSSDPAIDLGPYVEPIRRFLRGETRFPEYVALTIGVLPPDVARRTILVNRPYRGSNRRWHNYLFYIPGIEFSISVGKAVDVAIANDSFATNALHPIMVFDFSAEIWKVLKMMYGGAKVAKNVHKYLKKRS